MKGDAAMRFVCFRIDGVAFRRFRVCRRFCLNWDSWDFVVALSGVCAGGFLLAPLPPSGRGDVFVVDVGLVGVLGDSVRMA